jgi:3',5'-cyclic AMP phosphodiesterase CpdA
MRQKCIYTGADDKQPRAGDEMMKNGWIYAIHLLILVSLMVTAVGCAIAENRQIQPPPRLPSGQPLRMIAATDMHYLAQSLNDGGSAFQSFVENGDGKQLLYSDELMQALEYQVFLRKADIVLFSGDITNNGEQQSHADLQKRLRDIEATGARVYVVPGNHDILNPWARRFKEDSQYKTDYITPEEFRLTYGDYGYDEAISVDKSSLSYLAAPSDDVWLLMLDSARYRRNEEINYPQLDGEFSASTLKWIERCGKLAADSGAKLIAVMHHNLLVHSEMLSEGFTLNNSAEAVEVFRKAGIQIVLSGHSHQQSIVADQKNGQPPVYDISEGALSAFPHLFGILDYTPADHTFSYEAVALDVEGWAKQAGVKDPQLLEFTSYSETNILRMAKAKYYKRLSASPVMESYSQEELTMLAEFIGRMNRVAMAGGDPSELNRLKSSKGYQLWSQTPDGAPFKSYIMRATASREGAPSNRKLTVVQP